MAQETDSVSVGFPVLIVTEENKEFTFRNVHQRSPPRSSNGKKLGFVPPRLVMANTDGREFNYQKGMHWAVRLFRLDFPPGARGLFTDSSSRNFAMQSEQDLRFPGTGSGLICAPTTQDQHHTDCPNHSLHTPIPT